MKRLLWVTALPPAYDAGGGGQIRQAHLIDALADRFEVSLLVAGRLEDAAVRSRVAGVHEVAAGLAADPRGPWRRRARDLWWLAARRESDEVARHAAVRRALGPRAVAAAADITCVEYIGLAPILPRERRGLWALTLHNLTSGMARHSASIAPGARQRAMLGLEERHARRVERWAVGAYDLVTAVSAEDAAALGPGPVVVPNGVDIARFTVTAIPVAPRVVFTAALHTLPNRDGISWFCAEVWPRVRSAQPDATLAIVGARPPAEIRALHGRAGITVHADVPDVVPFLNAARVAIVPLRIGTGSRLKALEAMAAGRPVVGTHIGLGGLGVTPGRDVVVADAPEDFAVAVVSCLSDMARAQALARRGRAVASVSDWRRIGADYASLLAARAWA